MKLTVPANQLDIVFMSMSDEQALEPKKVYGTDEQKTDDQGRPLYAAKNLQAVMTDDEGNSKGADKSVTLNLRQNKPLQFGQVYRLTGQVTVTHYVGPNNRMAVSLIADSVEPVSRKAD